MTKISQLDSISGSNVRSGDLFVTVSIDQGENGTKNITRAELVKAIQKEVFSEFKADGGDYINNMDINDPNISITEQFTPNISNDDYFFLKDASLGKTVAISYQDLYEEISKTSKKSNKVYVSIDGSDSNNGSYLNPVATLDKAVELAQLAAGDGVFSGYPGDTRQGIPTSITVLPGDYYTNGNLALPDRCTMVSSNGQYATRIIMNSGYENENCILLGSGCYVQGFSFFNLIVDNFDYPSKGFAFAFRPGALILRSPYIRDCSQISNYFGREIPPLLNPFNSRGTIDDLGYEVKVSSVSGTWEVGDSVSANNGITGYVSRVTEIGEGTIYIRNNSDNLEIGSLIESSSGGTAVIDDIGEEDFPNKEVGRGGGLILADRAVLDQDSLFPYVLAFGATPRTQNGIGYVAKNGAGINGISSLSIFARCAFYALDGGQITLNNSGTQFGDISMRAKGSTPVHNPRETTTTLVKNEVLADDILSTANTIIDDMWDHISVTLGYNVNEELTRRDALNFIRSVSNDFREGSQTGTRIFTAGLFNYEGKHVFPVFNPTTDDLKYVNSVSSISLLPLGSTADINDAYIVYTSDSNIYSGTVYYWNGSVWASDGPNDITLLNAFTDSFDRMRNYMKNNLIFSGAESLMLDGLIDDVLIKSLRNPVILNFGSLIESLSHQFNLASAGVNINALPINFRRLGQSISASASILQEDGGRVRWSGADELNNQYFAKGLRINGRTGRIEGRPFTSSVRKLARRASNSRAIV